MSKTVHPLAAGRAARLRHGINLSHWYSQVPESEGYTPAHFQSFISRRDIGLIASMGFDHVRFPIAPEPVLDATGPEHLPAGYMAGLDSALAMILQYGLAAIIDIHPGSDFKKQLADNDDFADSFVSFWGALAAHFSPFDSERVFFEVLNEPELRNPGRWNGIQNRAAEAIRRSAPSHTLVVSGDQWSQLSQLPLLEPPPDGNVICNFHMYEPLGFTHQGAGWAPSWTQATKGLTYPSDPAFVGNFLEGVGDPDAIRELNDYREENWNAARYGDLLAGAAEWGREHGRILTCNEFGVYKTYAPRASRLAWLRDTSRALEEHGIGWTMWDYAGQFAVVTGPRGGRVPDREVLEALGLNTP